MKKLINIFLIVFLMLSVSCAGLKPIAQKEPQQAHITKEDLYKLMEESEAYYIRAFTAPNGGATGAMDAVGCQSLNTNDLGLTFWVAQSQMLFYYYDSTATTAEDTTHYSVIEPDDVDSNCSGNGNWILFESMNFSPTSLPTITFRDSDGLGADKDAGWIKVNMETLTDGLEDSDMCFRIQQGGADTVIACFDESDDRWEIPTTKGLAFGTIQWDNGSDSIDKDAIESIVVSAVWNAGGLNADGTQCTDPAEVTLNSGPKQYTISCADNAASTVYGHMIMPDSWDGNAVSFEIFVFHGTTESITFAGDFSAQCRGDGETVSNSWTASPVAADVSITTANQIESATAASVTPVGTCAGGDMLWFRWVMDAATSDANAANTDILGIKMEYTTVIGD